MLSSRLFFCPTLRLRRFTTALAMVAYLGSVIGFPLPVAAAVDTSTPFPCQHHRCGCSSAAQCWHSCCCYTPAERIAWAKAHNVTIPAEARLAMAEAEEAEEEADEERDCCASRRACSHCHEGDSHADQLAAGHECQRCATSEKSAKPGWVIGIQAAKCRGLSTEWIASGASLPLAILPLWQFEWTPRGHVLPAADPFLLIEATPPVPPPRV